MVWGLDMVGPFEKAHGGYTHLLVAVTKWIEVRPITNVRAEETVKFFTDIIHRFGVPNSIITDNGTNFTVNEFLEWCDEYHVRVDYWAAVAHPETNGQVERANDMILQGIKPRIFDRLQKYGRRWLQELPAVIWSLRTTRSRATGFTPFYMVYGSEAVLPTDLEYGSSRVEMFDQKKAETFLEDAIDQIDEAREAALLHSAKYQQALHRYHDRRVRTRELQPGDLVLRRIQSTRERRKLTSPWEGPYIIHQVLRPGLYKLITFAGRIFDNAWNIQQLRRFYP